MTTFSQTFALSAAGSAGLSRASMLTWLAGLAGKGTIVCQQLMGNNADTSPYAFVQNTFNITGKWVGGVGLNYYNNDASMSPPTFGTSGNSYAIPYWQAGGIVLLSGFNWPNPGTGAVGSGAAQSGPVNATLAITPGNQVYTNWRNTLNAVAGGIQELITAGVYPMIRPLHEMNFTGVWWWDAAQVSDAQYVALWQDMYNFFGSKGFNDHLIYVYAENGGNHRSARYPGSAYVDVVGFDAYIDDPVGYAAGNYGDKPLTQMAEFNKPTAWCEWGSNTGPTDEMRIVNAVRNTNLIYWEQWSFGWSIDTYSNASTAMNDPWVLTRDKLNRPK